MFVMKVNKSGKYHKALVYLSKRSTRYNVDASGSSYSTSVKEMIIKNH